MDKNARIAYLENKIQVLTNRDRENANVVRKLERELRSLKGIPKLEVKWVMMTNVEPYSASKSANTKAKKK